MTIGACNGPYPFGESEMELSDKDLEMVAGGKVEAVNFGSGGGHRRGCR